MNREIKFRVWTGEMMLNAQDEFRLSFGAEKPELYVHLSDGEFDDVPIESVMQYTGLKDKNGKEIYEGDIIENKNWDRFAIIWLESFGCWGRDCVTCKAKFFLENSPDKIIVIGNIYENPELLNTK